MNRFKQLIVMFFIINVIFLSHAHAQLAMTNVYGRDAVSLNGQWNAIVDPTGIGDWRQVWEERKPEKKTDFFEYSFEGGLCYLCPGVLIRNTPSSRI